MSVLSSVNRNRHNVENVELKTFFGTLKNKMSSDKQELTDYRKTIIEKKNHDNIKMKQLEDEYRKF
jgi:hypothetical protein